MNKLLAYILYIVGFILQYIFLRNIIISIELLSSLISIFSIFFGFYIVALSIFATSKFVSTLYSDEVKKNGFVTTNLHLLLDRYRFSLILNLISIFYLLFLIFLFSPENTFLFKNFCSYFVIPLVIHNFICAYRALSQLIKIIKQDAKISKNK